MTQKQIEDAIKSILESIEKDREREIVARRYGLFDRRETLEQIGEMLGITRERVRQLEKVIVARLKENAKKGNLKPVGTYNKQLLDALTELGNVARVSTLVKYLTGERGTKIDEARIAFIADLSPDISLIS